MHPVLVVDDDPGVRDVLADALEADGFEVSTASNGREALRCIGVEEPAVMLLDLQMPVMDGRELLRTLHQARLDVPVVLMSATPQVAGEAAEAHAAGYLSKPFDLDQALSLVERLAHRAA